MKTLIAALLMVSATFAYAQDVDFSMLNVRSNTQVTANAAQPTALTAPPQDANGQGAPYYGNYQTSWYAQPTYSNGDLNYRYQNVKQALSSYAGYYGWFSRERQYYSDAARQGENLYVRYLKYRDAYSYAALNQWCQQWEYQFGYGGQATYNYNNNYYNNTYSNTGWNSGYTCTCYVDRFGRTISSSCQIHGSYAYSNNGYTNNTGYYDNNGYYANNNGYYTNTSTYYNNGYYNNGSSYGCTCYRDAYGRTISTSCRIHGYYYPQGSYAYPNYQSVNNPFISGLQVGNGVGNIVQGQRYDNGLQTAGGVLSTVGGILNIIDSARR